MEVTPAKDCFVAKARVYPSYRDGPECYLAEATASRGPDPAHPSVSPREWAQTAAVGVALRNAGFGLQFGAAGEEIAEKAPEELGSPTEASAPAAVEEEYAVEELSPEERVKQAMGLPCPITKYTGRTLGDVLSMDPKAIHWIANKFTGNAEISAAAKLICEYAREQAAV